MVRSTTSRSLTVFLVTWGLLTAASVQAGTGPGPIARAVEREAVASLANPRGQVAGRFPTDWSRVARLKPSAEVVLTRSGAPAARRHVLQVDEAGLIVLNEAAFPASVRDVLLRTMWDHPDYFLRARQGESILFAGRNADRNLRLTREGVIEGDRRLAALEDFVEIVPRTEVREVSALVKHVGRHVKRGVLVGAIVGAGVAGIAVANCSGECGGGLVGGGAIVGTSYGALIGLIVGGIAPRSAEVIYRDVR